MKRLFVLTVLSSAAFLAHATNGGESNNTNCNGQGNSNSPCSGNGGSIISGGGSPSHAEARARALSIAASLSNSSAMGGNARASGGRATANTGASTSSVGNVAGGSSAVDLSGARIGGGDTYYPKQTPSAYAPQVDRPPSSCRLYVGLGGSTASGSGSGGIPIGNDEICLHEKRDYAMRKANQRRPGTFSDEDFLRNDCTIEGLQDTQACKSLKKE